MLKIIIIRIIKMKKLLQFFLIFLCVTALSLFTACTIGGPSNGGYGESEWVGVESVGGYPESEMDYPESEITSEWEVESSNNHTCEYTIDADENYHTVWCSICGEGEQSAHYGGTVTCLEKAKCEVCDYSYGDYGEHNHFMKTDENEHWYECECGDIIDREGHFGGIASCTQKAVCDGCDNEYGLLKSHEYDTINFDSTQHWYECECGDIVDREGHFGGIASCTQKAVCEACDNEYGLLKSHEYDTVNFDSTQHWYECECGAKDGFADHSGGEATYFEHAKCSTCNQIYGELLEDIYSDGLVFTLVGDSYTVTGYSGDSSEVIIPSVYKNKYVTAIGARAFYDCYWLTGVEISDSITSIGYEAFYACSLTSVEISDSVTTIGSAPFACCRSLTNIEVSENNRNYKTIDGILYSKDGTTLIQYSVGKKDTSFIIPDSVTSIGLSAFESCDSLINVEIPDSVTEIGVLAFSSCHGLTSIEIPDSVTSIGGGAFYYCPIEYAKMPAIAISSLPESKLKTVVITGGTIGDYAFDKCSSLTNVVILDSVTSIGEGAFRDCSSLTNIEVSENNKNYKSIDEVLYSKNGTILIQYPKGKKDTSFIIPNSVTTIGGWAFYSCSSLTSVEIPNSVTTIGVYSFYDCDSLTSVVIPDSVITIGGCAFWFCDSLMSAVIRDSVTTIGIYAFEGCRSLTSVEIGKSVTLIGQSAFDKCTSLTSVVIGDSVTSIGDYAFSYCDSLTSIYYKGTAEEWAGISIYSGNDKLTSATRYYYIENEADVPTDGGNYWHYDENGEIAVW